MSAIDISQVNAKLAWATEHFDTAHKEISLWLKHDAHRIVHEHNEKFTQHYFRAEFGDPPQLERWSLMFGDAITNLRDSLDHLIYAIAHLPGSPLPAKADNAAFIIRKRKEDFTRDERTRLCSVAQPVRDAVLRFQPFNRPHLPLPPLLSVLSDLANGTKHKLLSVVLTVPQEIDIEFVSHSQPNTVPAQMALNKRGILEGKPFAVFELAQPDPNCQLKAANIKWGIALVHAPRIGSSAYDATHTDYGVLLRLLFEEVEGLVREIVAVASQSR